MDDIDLDILRWMFPGGVWLLSGTDPRINPAEIASHVGLDRSSVWDRIRRWRREGFWNGYEVKVNVAVLGVGVFVAQIEVEDAAEGWTLMEQLEQVDGVLAADLIFGDSATTRDVELVVAFFVADDPERIERRLRFIRQLPQARNVIGPIRWKIPPCPRKLTPLDWRILSCIVANPNAPVARVARLVGVSLKTFDHHFSRLMDDKVMAYYPKIDWAKLGCLGLIIYCRGQRDVDRVHRALESRFPHSIQVSLDGMDGVGPDYDPSRCFEVIVPAHSPNSIQTLVHELSQVPGVRQVRPELEGPVRVFNGWIKQRIAEQLTSRSDSGAACSTRAASGHGRAKRPPERQEQLVLASP